MRDREDVRTLARTLERGKSYLLRGAVELDEFHFGSVLFKVPVRHSMCRNPEGNMKLRRQNSAGDLDFVYTNWDSADSRYNGMDEVGGALFLVYTCRLI